MNHKHLVLTLLGVCATVGLAIPLRAADDLQDPRDGVAFRLPVRRPPGTPPSLPPDLPSNANDIRPLTLHVVVRNETGNAGATIERRTVSRTADRVHVRVAGDEWLFERNPVDPRRVAAQFVQHARKTIVLHEESDLRNAMGITGWVDLLMLGVDPRSLANATAASEFRVTGGLRFQKHTAGGRSRGVSDVSEVWWNRDYLLPGRLIVRNAAGTMRMDVERVSPGVDAEMLRPPASRFPGYKVVDVVQWLEGH